MLNSNDWHINNDYAARRAMKFMATMWQPLYL